MVVPNVQKPLEEGGMHKGILTQFIWDCPISMSNINLEKR